MHTIFISYRRDGGEIMAQMLYDRLTNLGYSVFYDVVVLKGGRFNAKLLEAIEQATDFILVLSPGALDRCVNDGDWVREEIKHAFDHKKNIIPVLLRSFTFPEDLPQDITEIRNQNGVDFTNMGYFEARFLSLVERLKTPVPVSSHQTHEADEDYETFFQKEMKDCQTMLHLIDEHWHQLVIESSNFAPITAKDPPERLSLILGLIDTWTEDKEKFETKVNASLDLRETGYIQSSKVKLEQYYESIVPYQERVKAFAELADIEAALSSVTAASRESFKKIEELRERVSKLPDDVIEQMTPENTKHLAQLIKYLNAQIQFEREMAAVEKKYSALPEAIRDESYAFSHDATETAARDMEALDAMIALCVSVCDTYNVNMESPNEWILTDHFDSLLSHLPSLNALLEKGRVFLYVVDFCKQIDTLSVASSIERSEVYAIVPSFASLGEQELAFMKQSSVEHYNSLYENATQTDAVMEKARETDALFATLPTDAREGDIRYSYDTYEDAYASTVALEGWLEQYKVFKALFDAQQDKRFFSDEDMALSQGLISRAQGARATLSFHSDALTKAHEVEEEIQKTLGGTTFEPDVFLSAAQRLDALEEVCVGEVPQNKKRPNAKVLISKDVFEKIVGYEEFLLSFRQTEDEFNHIFENVPLRVNNVEEVKNAAERLKMLRAKAEQLLGTLAECRQAYETVDLQGEPLVTHTEKAFVFEAEAKKIALYGELLDWAKEHETVTAAELKQDSARRKETKQHLKAYGKVKRESKKYDTEKDLRMAYRAQAKVHGSAARSIGLGRAVRFGLPILTLLAFIIAAFAPIPQIAPATLGFWQYAGILLGIACLNIPLWRLIPAMRGRLFAIPLVLYGAYFFLHLLPEHLRAAEYTFWYLPHLALLGILLAVLGGIVPTPVVSKIFAGACKALAILSVILIVLLPFWSVVQESGPEALEGVVMLECLLDGIWSLLVCLIAGGLWIEIYAGSTLTLLNAALLFGILTRFACHSLRKRLRASMSVQKESEQKETVAASEQKGEK